MEDGDKVAFPSETTSPLPLGVLKNSYWYCVAPIFFWSKDVDMYLLLFCHDFVCLLQFFENGVWCMIFDFTCRSLIMLSLPSCQENSMFDGELFFQDSIEKRS